MLGSVVALGTGHGLVSIVVLVIGVMLPVMKRKKAPKGVEDWPDTKPPSADKPLPTGAIGG
jgi:hypothetical protein